MKIVLVYVPVIQKGYIDFLSAQANAREIYIWGKSIIALEDSLRKEVRAIDPQQAKIALNALLGREIKIAEADDLQKIAVGAKPLVMPDDAISHSLLENSLSPLGLTSSEFQPVFLRWDKVSSTIPQEVSPDATVSASEFAPLKTLAEKEAKKSSDWWRHVGAVLFGVGGHIYYSAHNQHLPTEYAPYINGDPRGSFSKGLNIDISTAVHAEVQVLGIAAKNGLQTKGLKLLTTTFPCPTCAKLIAQCGIAELFYTEGYAMVDGEKVLRDAGIKIFRVV